MLVNLCLIFFLITNLSSAIRFNSLLMLPLRILEQNSSRNLATHLFENAEIKTNSQITKLIKMLDKPVNE